MWVGGSALRREVRRLRVVLRLGCKVDNQRGVVDLDDLLGTHQACWHWWLSRRLMLWLSGLSRLLRGRRTGGPRRWLGHPK